MVPMRRRARIVTALAAVASLGVVVVLVSCGSDAEPSDIPAKHNGLVATIRNVRGSMLSHGGLRLQHRLKNITDTPIELYDLENSVFPEFEGMGCVGGGPSGEKPKITVAPGDTVSRWVASYMITTEGKAFLYDKEHGRL